MKNVYSAIKVFHHKALLDAMEKGEIAAPLYIRMKPTNFCNHHCSYCSYGSGNPSQKTTIRDSVDHKDMIPRGKMMEIIEDMGRMGVKAVTFSGGGEPLTYPYMLEAVERMKVRNIDLSLISNGQLLCDEIAEAFSDAKWVRISFDSPDAEEYARLRGITVRSYEKVVANIREFAKKKRKECIFGANYVIGRDNYKRIYEAAKLLYELGMDNVKFAAIVDNNRNYHISIKDEAIEQIQRAKEDFESDTFQIINNYESDWNDKNFSTQSFPTCYTCRMVTVIAADQKIYLCHTRAYDSEAVVGDIRDKSFYEVWYSEETRSKLLGLDPQKECKNFCAFQERNQLIQAYFDVNYDHINFI